MLACVAAGAPVPEGADAVVQIENTEQLPDRPDGEKRIKIVKVSGPHPQSLHAWPWCFISASQQSVYTML